MFFGTVMRLLTTTAFLSCSMSADDAGTRVHIRLLSPNLGVSDGNRGTTVVGGGLGKTTPFSGT